MREIIHFIHTWKDIFSLKSVRATQRWSRTSNDFCESGTSISFSSIIRTEEWHKHTRNPEASSEVPSDLERIKSIIKQQGVATQQLVYLIDNIDSLEIRPTSAILWGQIVHSPGSIKISLHSRQSSFPTSVWKKTQTPVRSQSLSSTWLLNWKQFGLFK